MSKHDNDHPYIIAYGPSRDNISCFYVEVEKHLIPVSSASGYWDNLTSNKLFKFIRFYFQLPRECSWAEVFDFFFKIHKIFHLKYDTAIMNVMNFVQTFIYKVEDGQKKPTVQMKLLFNKMI